nr:FAD-binding protein [Streptomyces xiaopingdaonensis]
MRNWAGNLDLGAPYLARPESVDKLRRIVAESTRVRVLGARHSFSGLLPTSGRLVSLDRLPPSVEIDAGSQTATVSAGMRYTDVAAALQRAGYALANLASLSDITVAGACATGTHGSGDTQQGLAAAVAGMQLIGPEGDFVEQSSEVDQDTFAGGVVALGALGVVSRLTLRIEPAYEVAQSVRIRVPLDEVQAADGLAAVFGAAYSVSLFTTWADEAVVWLKQRVDRPGPGLRLGVPADRPTSPVPGADPSPCTDQSGVPGPWNERLPHVRAGTTGGVGGELQSEYFVPRAAAPAAFAALRELCPLLAPVLQVGEVRTVRGDGLWLSPAFEQDSVTFHFTWTKDIGRLPPVLDAVERALAPLGARPHWAKLTAMDGPRLRAGYRRASDFRELVSKRDPEGKFSSPLVDEVLSDEPS